MLNKLANATLHSNDGEISKIDETLDRQLLAEVKETVHHLLVTIYELPFEQRERLDRLLAARIGVAGTG